MSFLSYFLPWGKEEGGKGRKTFYVSLPFTQKGEGRKVRPKQNRSVLRVRICGRVNEASGRDEPLNKGRADLWDAEGKE